MSELDSALERLRMYAFEDAHAEPNYAPMAVSALDQLGHASLTPGLLDVCLPRLVEWAGEGGRVLEPHEVEANLGEDSRAADWLATFEARLAQAPWPRVLSAAMVARCARPASPPLFPHAVVRLGYAVRNLERSENETRLRELARALAYLFARARRADATHATVAPDSWIQRAKDASPQALETLLGDITREGALRVLANPDQRRMAAQAVTAPVAYRALLAYLGPDTAAHALISLWMGIEAELPPQLAARPSDGEGAGGDLEVARCAQDVSEVRYRAACSLHEHAIVLAESCLREEALTKCALLRRAAADAALRLDPPGYRAWR